MLYQRKKHIESVSFKRKNNQQIKKRYIISAVRVLYKVIKCDDIQAHIYFYYLYLSD